MPILKIAADGSISTVVAGPELDWVDAIWIDDAGDLLPPAAQLNRTPALNHGVDAVKLPTVVYRLAVGATPVRR